VLWLIFMDLNFHSPICLHGIIKHQVKYIVLPLRSTYLIAWTNLQYLTFKIATATFTF